MAVERRHDPTIESSPMSIAFRFLAGVLLVAHGSVHLLYLAPEAEDPKCAFTLKSSWLVPDSARSVASILIAATVAAFVLPTLAVWGVPGLASAWPAVALVAAASSLALLIAYWDVR